MKITPRELKVIEKFDRDARVVHQVVIALTADREEAVSVVSMVLAQLLRSGVPADEREPLLTDAILKIRYCWDMCDDVELENAAKSE